MVIKVVIPAMISVLTVVFLSLILKYRKEYLLLYFFKFKIIIKFYKTFNKR